MTTSRLRHLSRWPLAICASLILVGCTGTPTEGNLPPERAATPEETKALIQKVEAGRNAGGNYNSRKAPGMPGGS